MRLELLEGVSPSKDKMCGVKMSSCHPISVSLIYTNRKSAPVPNCKNGSPDFFHDGVVVVHRFLLLAESSFALANTKSEGFPALLRANASFQSFRDQYSSGNSTRDTSSFVRLFNILKKKKHILTGNVRLI